MLKGRNKNFISENIFFGKTIKIPENVFFCLKSKSYINIVNVCDEEIDCPFGEDEENCSYHFSEFFTCHSNESEMIIYRKVCDFHKDCQDGSDEENCGKKLNDNKLTLIFFSSKKLSNFLRTRKMP